MLVGNELYELMSAVAGRPVLPTDEFFTFVDSSGDVVAWDVTEAKRIVADGRPVIEWDASQFIARQLVNSPFDREYAASHPKSDAPVILVIPPDGAPGEYAMIDGVHRVVHAVMNGRRVVPAYVLDRAEAKRCLLPRAYGLLVSVLDPEVADTRRQAFRAAGFDLVQASSVPG